jgi:hypothetical protein
MTCVPDIRKSEDPWEIKSNKYKMFNETTEVKIEVFNEN